MALPNLLNAQTVTLVFGSLSVIYGLQGIFIPRTFAAQFGYPSQLTTSSLKYSKKGPTNPFVIATGGRTAALGLVLLVFAWEGQLNAAGTVLACCSLSGLCDAVCCYLAGNVAALAQHGVGAVTLGTLGWWLRHQS